jgi:putative SOS response-associated peptidase YedK
LEGYWARVYGRCHGIMVIDSFFENVSQHVYERRELAPGEKETNMVLHFNPRNPEPMAVACLWSHWRGEGGSELYSFAAVTDEPPDEIRAAGHDRCVIPLQDDNIQDWLSPEKVTRERLREILDDRERPYYEHKIAA